jgi:hypothetical protein
MQGFGHGDCVVYAEVITGGEVADADSVGIEKPTLP